MENFWQNDRACSNFLSGSALKHEEQICKWDEVILSVHNAVSLEISVETE